MLGCPADRCGRLFRCGSGTGILMCYYFVERDMVSGDVETFRSRFSTGHTDVHERPVDCLPRIGQRQTQLSLFPGLRDL